MILSKLTLRRRIGSDGSDDNGDDNNVDCRNLNVRLPRMYDTNKLSPKNTPRRGDGRNESTTTMKRNIMRRRMTKTRTTMNNYREKNVANVIVEMWFRQHCCLDKSLPSCRY